MAKKNLLLLNETGNFFDFSQSTIDTFKLDDDDSNILKDAIRLHLNREKNHFLYPQIKRQSDNDFQNFDFVSISKYPLPSAFNVRTNKVIVNTSIWGRRSLQNISAQDLFSVAVYSYLSAIFTMKEPKSAYADIVCDYLSRIYIMVFAKKYGLSGSYIEEIPKLRFLVNTHTLISYFNMSRKTAYNHAANLAKIRASDFDIDLDTYDFSNTKQFIKSLGDSSVLHGITLYEFVSTMVRRYGVVSLPMFEDGMRFISTIGASASSSTIFPIQLQKIDAKLFTKLLSMIQISVR